MFKKSMLIFLICLFAIVYADNGIGNVANVGNIPSSNPKSMKASSIAPVFDVRYVVYNYQMKPAEFTRFLETNSLSKTVDLTSATNIVSLTILQKVELDALYKKLSQKFSNKFSGGSTCIVNNDLCAGGMGTSSISDPKTGKPATVDKTTITFKVFNNNNVLSAKVISNNTNNDVHTLNSLKSEAMLSDIKNKNYVMISQIPKDGSLYGQIIQISFSGK